MQTLLLDLRRWLEQVELGIRSEPSGDRDTIEKSVIDELQEPILPTIGSWFSRFDEVSDKVDDEFRPVHRAFARRLLYPLLCFVPLSFTGLTISRSLGDYEMVNMILREPYEGASFFAKIVNVCFLKNPPAEAHRNRIKYLTGRLGRRPEPPENSEEARESSISGSALPRNFRTYEARLTIGRIMPVSRSSISMTRQSNTPPQLQDTRVRPAIVRPDLNLHKKSVHQIFKELPAGRSLNARELTILFIVRAFSTICQTGSASG